jgi:ribosomal protein L4
MPLVVSDAAESISKTSKALDLLKKLGADADSDKARDSKALRRGKGKMRNRRYVLRKGPLVVYGADHGISKAFRWALRVVMRRYSQHKRVRLIRVAQSVLRVGMYVCGERGVGACQVDDGRVVAVCC